MASEPEYSKALVAFWGHLPTTDIFFIHFKTYIVHINIPFLIGMDVLTKCALCTNFPSNNTILYQKQSTSLHLQLWTWIRTSSFQIIYFVLHQSRTNQDATSFSALISRKTLQHPSTYESQKRKSEYQNNLTIYLNFIWTMRRILCSSLLHSHNFTTRRYSLRLRNYHSPHVYKNNKSFKSSILPQNFEMLSSIAKNPQTSSGKT